MSANREKVRLSEASIDVTQRGFAEAGETTVLPETVARCSNSWLAMHPQR